MSDFGQQQDFGEDGTRKEGGGRGAKFKSFMAGTKNKFSPLGKMKRRDNAEEQQQQQQQQREEEESTIMMGDDVGNNEDGNDQKNNNNKFKRFVGRAGDALKKTGTAGVQLTKKAVANTKDRVQAIRKDQPSNEKEEEGEEIILMESEDNEDEDYSSEEPPNQAATTTTTVALEEETTTTTTTTSMPRGNGLDLTEGGEGTSVNNEGGTAVEEEEEETALHQTVEGENQAETNQTQTENDNNDDDKEGMAAMEKETPEVKEEEEPTSSTPDNEDILLEKEEEKEAAVATREAKLSLAVDIKDSEPEETTEPLNTTTGPPVEEEEEEEDTKEKAPILEEQAEAVLSAVAQGEPPVKTAEEEEERPIDMEPTETSLPIDTKPRDEPPSVDSRDAPIDVAVQDESSPIIGADAKDDEPELVEAPETPAEQLVKAEEAAAEQATIEGASGGIDNDQPPVAPETSEESSASPQVGEILEKTVLETTAPALEETAVVEDKAALEATKESEPDRQKETASAIKPKPEETSPPKKKGLRRLVTGTKNIVAKGKSLATKRGSKNDQDGGQKEEQSESGQDDQTTPKKAKGLKRLVTGTKTVSKKAVSKVKNIIPRGKSSEAESVTDDSTLGEGFTDDASTMSSGSDTKLGKPVNWSKNAVQKTRAKISNLVRKTSSADDAASVGEKSLNVSEITTIDENKADEVIDDDEEEEVGADEVAVQMSPFLLYFLHDTVIATFGFSVVALIPTLFNWSLITQSQVPTSVFLAWMIFAFGVGQEIGRWKGMRAVPTKQKSPAVRETSVDSSCIATQTSTSLRNQKEGYALAMTLTKPLKVKLKFGARIKKGFKKLNKVRKKAWTALACGDNSAVDRYTWTKGGFVQIDDKLNNRLLRNPSFRRGSLQEIVAVEAMGEGAAAANDRTKSFRMGAFDDEAETLDDAVVMPACRLRGMDCFLTDNCEVDMAKHAFLVRNGLRKKPTFLLNLILNWCNILVYFELPDWFKDFDSMVEHEDDSEEVKAIKRFVSGDDQYRNERLKVLPALAEGPMAIKMLMPSKKEMTVHGDALPLTWTKYDVEELPNGTTLQPCLEVDLNVMASKVLSKTSSFVRRYVKSMALDIALTIGKADEPAACVGLFRFNKIDIDQCPELPDRDDDYDDDDDDNNNNDAVEAAG